jgi:hypothetical protein
MTQANQKKTPTPDNSIYEKKGPETEPNIYPGSGQHQPDILDERSKKKRNNRPQRPDDINPEVPGNDNPEEYNDGEPVEEKSPKVQNL